MYCRAQLITVLTSTAAAAVAKNRRAARPSRYLLNEPRLTAGEEHFRCHCQRENGKRRAAEDALPFYSNLFRFAAQ